MSNRLDRSGNAWRHSADRAPVRTPCTHARRSNPFASDQAPQFGQAPLRPCNVVKIRQDHRKSTGKTQELARTGARAGPCLPVRGDLRVNSYLCRMRTMAGEKIFVMLVVFNLDVWEGLNLRGFGIKVLFTCGHFFYFLQCTKKEPILFLVLCMLIL